jgi:hypothetical protein
MCTRSRTPPSANLNHGVKDGHTARCAQRLLHVKKQFRKNVLIENVVFGKKKHKAKIEALKKKIISAKGAYK